MEPVLAIVGPTATGKSALGIALAELLGGEVVSADALQVYRGLDIGTAKPTASERARVRHHLVDVLDPHESFSAGEFARRARHTIAGIQARGLTAVVTGGSGLYLRALFKGLQAVPAVPAAVREELARQHARDGLGELYRELALVDPRTAKQLAPGDTQRILRALEVYHATGCALSDWRSASAAGAPEAITALRIGLTLPRAILYDRIESRVRRMVAEGWVAEVSRLYDPASPEPRAFQAIGYRQLVRHLRGEWPLERAVEETTKATRRYAKRQETWFRREPDVRWFDADRARDELPMIAELFQSVVWGGS